MTCRRPYTAREICEALGITPDTLYRTRELRHTRDALPRPITEHPLRWERSTFDAWNTRFHPDRPPAPANDPVRPPDAVTIAEQQAIFHAAYASPPLDTRRQPNRR